MKFILEQSPAYREPEVRLRCRAMDRRLSTLARQIQLYAFSINGRRDGRQYTIPLEDIYYFESVDENTFVYCKDEVYECSLKLYELEEQLQDTSCLRVSKACVLNTQFVESVRPLMGAKLEAALQNGEHVIVNRHYVPAFKAQFGIGEKKL